MSRWSLEYWAYRIALPFRLRRQAMIRKARSQSSKQGWATRRKEAKRYDAA